MCKNDQTCLYTRYMFKHAQYATKNFKLVFQNIFLTKHYSEWLLNNM